MKNLKTCNCCVVYEKESEKKFETAINFFFLISVTLHLQIPLSQVLSFAIMKPSQNMVIISHPCKSKGRCSLQVHLSRPTSDALMPSAGIPENLK